MYLGRRKSRDIDSLPEYDPISARITENKGRIAEKKGLN
ncbi:MAG: hypothetical protein K0S61_4722 [Anaerocolumna sp.]|nr:hypothetical protein [Anaerocolumna sp.]